MIVEARSPTAADATALAALWNEAAAPESSMYRRLSAERFAECLAGLRQRPADLLILARTDSRLSGCAIGCRTGLTDPDAASLGALLVRPEYRGQGLGARLLTRFEQEAGRAGCSRVLIAPASHLRLTWGVDPATFGYRFMWEHGYATTEIHLYMDRDLVGWRTPPSVAQRVRKLAVAGVRVGLAAAKAGDSLVRCAQDLGFDATAAVFRANADLAQPDPVLVATAADRVLGFVGPLTVTPCGMPEFQMIAVRDRECGRGIGSVLFALAMQFFADHGATHMELMTGLDNPAQRIYFRTGFRTQRVFACLNRALADSGRRSGP